MAEKRQNKGTCFFCNKEYARRGMTRHLKACKARNEDPKKAGGKTKIKTLYHLFASDASSMAYWLHLEMDGNAPLRDLDDYLRTIWLECCGHLSDFLEPVRGGDEISMSEKIADVFYPGRKLLHIYDWGTSSETLIECVDTREGASMAKHPIFLMSRNTLPEEKCDECGKTAAFFCWGCLTEIGRWNPLCEKHMKTHKCVEDYGNGVIVNSPRLGMCGYSGPAKPPY